MNLFDYQSEKYGGYSTSNSRNDTHAAILKQEAKKTSHSP